MHKKLRMQLKPPPATSLSLVALFDLGNSPLVGNAYLWFAIAPLHATQSQQTTRNMGREVGMAMTGGCPRYQILVDHGSNEVSLTDLVDNNFNKLNYSHITTISHAYSFYLSLF
jgi:hypothetical protein